MKKLSKVLGDVAKRIHKNETAIQAVAPDLYLAIELALIGLEQGLPVKPGSVVHRTLKDAYRKARVK